MRGTASRPDRAVTAQTSASSRSGERPPDSPSGPKSAILSLTAKCQLLQRLMIYNGDPENREPTQNIPWHCKAPTRRWMAVMSTFADGTEPPAFFVRWHEYATPSMTRERSNGLADLRICGACGGSGNRTFLRAGKVAFRRCSHCGGRGTRFSPNVFDLNAEPSDHSPSAYAESGSQ